MTNLAFIGLGIMGSPMAVHLQQAGFQVSGYNRTPTAADRSSRPAGARRRRSPTPSPTPRSSR